MRHAGSESGSADSVTTTTSHLVQRWDIQTTVCVCVNTATPGGNNNWNLGMLQCPTTPSSTAPLKRHWPAEKKRNASLWCLSTKAPNKVRYRCDFPQAIRNAPMAEKGAFGRKKQNRHNARTKLECSSVLALPCCQTSLNHQFYGSKTLSNVFSLSNSEGNRPSVSTKRMPRSFRLCTFSGVGQW